MAGPTIDSLVILTDEIAATDVLYLLRGLGAGADRKFTGDLIVPSILTTNITGAINLNLYKGDLVIFSTPAAAITLTFSNMLPNGRKIIIVNKATAFNITCAGTLVETIDPSTTLHRVSDATSFYELQKETQGKYDIVIDTQAEFEYYLGPGTLTGPTTTEAGWTVTGASGSNIVTIPKDTSVLIKSNPSDGVTTHFKYDATNYDWNAYELKSRVNLVTSVVIHGEGIDQTIIARKSDNNFPMFVSDFLDQDAVTGVATNDFSVADSSNYQPGQTIEHSDDNAFYKITDVPDATSVIVDRTITGAAAGNISICQDSIELKDFTFDGRCDVDNLGGNRTNQAFNLQYCAHSNFEAKVINCKDTNGGAYDGNNLVYRLKISNVFHCEGTTAGGAIYQCSNSIIKYIYNCFSDVSGGACYSCDNCTISEIHNCYCLSAAAVVAGGACHSCNNCTISNIYNCYTETTAFNSNGGACYSCNNCTISNIYNCYTITTTQTAGGGACYDCKKCTISNIHNCSCSATGAGGAMVGAACRACDDCTISDIYDCSGDSTTGPAWAGACYDCKKCTISNIHNCSCVSTTGATAGGACHTCHDCTISNIHDCSVSNDDTDALGGACAECGINGNETIYLGSFTGNTDDTAGASRDTISNGFGLTLLQFDGATSHIGAEGAVDLD